MIPLIQPPVAVMPGFHVNLVVGQAGHRGRGVFAARDLVPGDLIEVAPVLPIAPDEARAIRPHGFAHNLYEWLELPDGSWTLALVTGLALLFNHSYEPNAEYDRDYDREAIVFRARRSIARGAEVLINYNGDPDCRDALWFDVR